MALLLGIGLPFSARSFSQEIEEPKKTPFQETADSILDSCILPLVVYWHFPHFTSWARFKGGHGDAEFLTKCKTFPDELMKAVANPESVDHDSAVAFLARYAMLTRGHAARLSERNLSVAVEHALAPHTAKIREALLGSLQSKAAKSRLLAAEALLSLDVSHAKANKVLEASAASVDTELVTEICGFIWVAHLTSPQAINCLRRLLKHRDMSVRHEAASAVITLGRSARDLAPDLVAFLETGKDAEGSYSYPFAEAMPRDGNLALMALESLKDHAKPALPTILARFAKANDEDQVAMLACLAHIGHQDDACLALVRGCLRSEKSKLKLAAACALLHLVPCDQEATDLLKKALADRATTTRVLDLDQAFGGASTHPAVEMCKRFGPPSRAIAASLLPMLDDQTEDIRIHATLALGRIGPLAREAVPGLEKLLAREEDAMTHTCSSTRAAAIALAQIGGKEAAALLRVADSNASGACWAMLYLPDLGDDLPPNALDVLVRALQCNDERSQTSTIALYKRHQVAPIALSNLGERARPVRRELERLLDDPEIGWIIDTALRRIPENPR
jgi:HEAT repeat protein